MSEQTKTATRTTDDAKSLKLLLGSVITRQPVKFETVNNHKVMVFEESYKDTTTKWLIEEIKMSPSGAKEVNESSPSLPRQTKKK